MWHQLVITQEKDTEWSSLKGPRLSPCAPDTDGIELPAEGSHSNTVQNPPQNWLDLPDGGAQSTCSMGGVQFRTGFTYRSQQLVPVMF